MSVASSSIAMKPLPLADRTAILIAVLSVVAVIWFSYLPFLYVTTAIGVDKAMLFVMLVTAIAILQAVRAVASDAKFSPGVLRAFILYALFPLYVLVTYLLRGMPAVAASEVFAIVVLNSLFAFQALSLHRQKPAVLGTLAALLSLYALFLAWSLATGEFSLSNLAFQSIFPGLDVPSIYQNAGMYVGILIALIVVLSRRWRPAARIAAWFSVPMLFVGMIALGGRAAITATTVVLAIIGWRWLGRGRNVPSKLLLLLLAGLLLVSVFDVRSAIPESNSIFGLSRLAVLLDGGDSSSRLFLFSRALELAFSDSMTLLFGAGPNAFPAFINQGPDMYPHNIVLELLAEYGMLGLLVFLLPIVYVVRRRVRALGSIAGDDDHEFLVFLIAVFVWTIYAFTGSLSSSWFLIFLTFLLYSIPDDDDDPAAV